MRSFSDIVREEFARGIFEEQEEAATDLTEDVMPVGTRRLLNLQNLRPQGFLKPMKKLTALSVSGLTSMWPFPQLFVGSKFTLLAYDDAFYQADNAYPPTTASQLVLRHYSEGLLTSITTPSGEMWHFADFGNSWFLVRPDHIVFKLPLDEMFIDNAGPLNVGEMTLLLEGYMMRTVCAANGRFVAGGFDANEFFASTWNDLWNQFYGEIPGGFKPVSDFYSVGENYVFWSGIGGIEHLFLIYPLLAQTGIIPSNTGYDITRPMFMDSLMANTWGFMPMNWQGKINVVKPLGNDVVVYGEGGVSLMTKVEEPDPTYGLTDLSLIGVSSRELVGGDNKEHVFLNAVGDLMRLGIGGKLDRVGHYNNLHRAWKQYDYRFRINVTDEREYFIATGNTGDMVFRLVPEGLYRDSYHIALTGIYPSTTSPHGFYKTQAVSDVIAVVELGWLDFGNSDKKRVTMIELGATLPSDVKWRVTVDSIYSDLGTGQVVTGYSDPQTITAKAHVKVRLTGVRFRFKFEFAPVTAAVDYSFEELKLTWIRITYQQIGKAYRSQVDVS